MAEPTLFDEFCDEVRARLLAFGPISDDDWRHVDAIMAGGGFSEYVARRVGGEVFSDDEAAELMRMDQ